MLESVIFCLFVAIIQYKRSSHKFNSTEKAKAHKKHSLHRKTAASVLLKMFFSGNERCLVFHSWNRVFMNVSPGHL